jgi:putative membrane protein
VPGAIDARFTLAAERTVLAWVRTALGFMAAGVAVVYVAADIEHPVLETALGLVMVGLGCAIALLGAWRWRRTMNALRDGGEMPGPSHVTFLIVGIVVVAVAIAVVIVVNT